MNVPRETPNIPIRASKIVSFIHNSKDGGENYNKYLCIAYNVSPHHAVVFGATKDFLRINFAYHTAPKTIERPL
jgi:hypothetical protein